MSNFYPLNPRFQRLALLVGLGTLDALARARVIVFGLGGVGSWCAEALARSGIGKLTIVDSDTVCITNINRQTQATNATVGCFKADALKARLLEINPACTLTVHNTVFCKESARTFGIEDVDYVIDAIDSLTNKLDLIEYTVQAGVPLFSSMGMAQKLNPAQLKTADIWDTQVCPLARLVRAGLRKRGFTSHFTTVYSEERLPRHEEIAVACGSGFCLCSKQGTEWCSSKKVINGSAVTVTATAGMILAGLVVQAVYAQYPHPTACDDPTLP
ncbi:MAG: tRNA threonylcarbamoyladenosine dehydratase [Treponema sp.]|nr:tRNA threonylcarbamoyladenosine dehydratase [Treponema sp.]